MRKGATPGDIRSDDSTVSTASTLLGPAEGSSAAS